MSHHTSVDGFVISKSKKILVPPCSGLLFPWTNFTFDLPPFALIFYSTRIISNMFSLAEYNSNKNIRNTII